MKNLFLSNEYISAFCLQVSLLVHAGITLEDGMYLLAEEEQEKDSKELLMQMAETVGEGKQLSVAMADTGKFPSYVVRMAAVGERTGRVEQAFRSMAEYYENRRRLMERVKSAVLYPTMLFVLMLFIIGILLIKVLPVFHQVYEQLGGSMDGLAGSLLLLGRGLKERLPVLLALLAVVIVATLTVYCHAGLRDRAVTFIKKLAAHGTIGKKISTSRFASAFSMGMMSGLMTEEALKLAASFWKEEPKAQAKYEACCNLLDQGKPLAEALKETGLLEPVYCRMLALGMKSGTADSVMVEIATRLEEDAQDAVERLVSKIEPAIVIVSSLLVGVILLAVMLPLMNIMASIG